MTFSEHEFIPYDAQTALASGRVLVLAPHPDDEVFGCGGAIMRHIQAGDPVRVVIVTDGARGLVADATDDALTRQRESRAAAGILGYGVPTFWELPDRGLKYDEALIRRILNALEEPAADLLYAPSWWEIHPDHFTLALAAAEAVRRCRHPVRLAMYEVGVPLPPTLLLDITDLRERKQAAMECFASQLKQQRYDRHLAALNCFRTYTLPATVLAAEALRLVTQDELREAPSPVMHPAAAASPSCVPPLALLVPQEQDRECASLREQLAARETELAQLANHALKLRQTIDALHSSTAWRITGPLRWLVSRWRAAIRE